MYYVYILRTTGNTFYTGYTNNIKRRIKEHREKGSRTAKYLRRFTDSKLVYFETYPLKVQAMSREWRIKRLTHDQKEELVDSEQGLLAE